MPEGNREEDEVADLIIDAHQHLWDLDAVDYPWLGPDVGPINRTFTPDEAEPLLEAAGVHGSVLVQAADSLEDTAAMLAVAAERDWVLGVVGWVPLLDPDGAAGALDRWQRDPRFCGVRHLIHDEPDVDWVLQPEVVESLGLLAARGVPFDLVAVQPRHLEHAPTLAEAVPDLRVVIDHLAKPPIRERGWEPWAGALARAAEHPNVFAKVSGLNTAADPATWSGEDLRPYVEHALSCFGADRLLFGSDWPVATLAGDYQRVFDETLVALSTCTSEERQAVLGGTAVRFYGLDVEVAR